MTELKRSFSKGKMNQDLDERLIPSNDYREALNVEISTSEDSNVGAVQTLKGNTGVLSVTIPSGSSCVGSIADEKNNKIYLFVAGYKAIGEGYSAPGKKADYILEYDSDQNTTRPVVVDVWETKQIVEPTPNFQSYIEVVGSSSPNDTNIRPGMLILGEFECKKLDGTTFTKTFGINDGLIVKKMEYDGVTGKW